MVLSFHRSAHHCLLLPGILMTERPLPAIFLPPEGTDRL